jgi:ABC-2 type transport system permease protein
MSTSYPQAKLSGLLASEARRLWHRRVVRWLFILAAVLYVLIIVIVYFNHAKNDPNKPAIMLDQSGRDGSVAVGVGIAILMFVTGATYAGAEWTQRTVVALLFWEPRRLRVTLAKVAVTTATAVIGMVGAQVIWLGTIFALASTRGSTARASDFWSDVLNRDLRVLLFTVLVAWLGFGIANLVRHSAASLGVGFVYFAIVEFAVAAWWHWAQQWLLIVNAGALLTRGGVDLHSESGNTERHISSLHGGLVWGVASIGVLAIGAVLFQRRDAT